MMTMSQHVIQPGIIMFVPPNYLVCLTVFALSLCVLFHISSILLGALWVVGMTYGWVQSQRSPHWWVRLKKTGWQINNEYYIL